MRCAENAHTAASNTKPAAHKTLLPMGQLRTVIGRENVVHRMQPTRTYNAPKPEQKTVQVKDSSTKQSYRQKPLPQPPEREGNSMNITVHYNWLSFLFFFFSKIDLSNNCYQSITKCNASPLQLLPVHYKVSLSYLYSLWPGLGTGTP